MASAAPQRLLYEALTEEEKENLIDLIAEGIHVERFITTGMHPIHQAKLRKNRQDLVKYLNAADILDHLGTEEILAKQGRENLVLSATPADRMDTLLSLLPIAGPTVYGEFRNALSNLGYGWLVSTLDKTTVTASDVWNLEKQGDELEHHSVHDIPENSPESVSEMSGKPASQLLSLLSRIFSRTQSFSLNSTLENRKSYSLTKTSNMDKTAKGMDMLYQQIAHAQMSIEDLCVPGPIVDQLRNIDFWSLDRYKVNFAKDFMIAQSFQMYQKDLEKTLERKLTRHFPGCRGSLLRIGSCWDGSKIGRLNEMDFLFSMDIPELKISKAQRIRGEYCVSTKGIDLLPRQFNVKFANCVEETILEIPLPCEVQHGGYASPDFSGVRFNGPASTAQFVYKSPFDGEFPISLDITAAFPVANDSSERLALIHRIDPLIAENSGTQIVINGPHIICDILCNTWRLSTAEMEAELLRVLPQKCSTKTALTRCKAIFHKVEVLNKEIPFFSALLYGASLRETGSTQKRSGIVEDLDHYLLLREPDQRLNLRKQLNFRMRYEHILIPPNRRRDFREADKNGLSINTAAVKHIILAYALEKKGAFSDEDYTISKKMIRLVLTVLADPVPFKVKHAFLDTNITKFSVLPCMYQAKQMMLAAIREECGLLLTPSRHVSRTI